MECGIDTVSPHAGSVQRSSNVSVPTALGVGMRLVDSLLTPCREPLGDSAVGSTFLPRRGVNMHIISEDELCAAGINEGRGAGVILSLGAGEVSGYHQLDLEHLLKLVALDTVHRWSLRARTDPGLHLASIHNHPPIEHSHPSSRFRPLITPRARDSPCSNTRWAPWSRNVTLGPAVTSQLCPAG